MRKRSFERFISVITGFVCLLSVCRYFPDSIVKADSETAAIAAAGSYMGAYNPCNKQDDREVPYDGSRWIQPVEWNVPTINPRNYKGGIMLFFDKLGLDPDYVRGKVQRVYFSLVGATEPVSLIKFHIFYDTRLTVKKNSDGELVNVGKAINDFTTGSAMIEEGQLAFYAYSEDTMQSRGSIFTIDFIIPENAEQGDLYPIGISYVDDGIVADTFIGSEKNAAERLQMTYVFTKGIYNGYIKMNGEKKTTTTTAVTVTTTTTRSVSEGEYELGDVNGDGLVNAVDASSVLAYYAMISANADGGYSEAQKLAADVDHDGLINAVDASDILAYYAYLSADDENIMPIEDFVNRKA